MLAPAVKQTLQPTPQLGSKTRLLVVSDSPDRIRALQVGLNRSEFEIVGVYSLEEMVAACHEPHDLVALDVNPAQIASVLRLIRSNASHSEVPVLVEASRLKSDSTLAGILPRYRAMPCSYPEMLTLVRGRRASVDEDYTRRGML